MLSITSQCLDHVLDRGRGVHTQVFNKLLTISYCNTYTAKPAHKVTSIKQSPALKGHRFICPIIEIFI